MYINMYIVFINILICNDERYPRVLCVSCLVMFVCVQDNVVAIYIYIYMVCGDEIL